MSEYQKAVIIWLDGNIGRSEYCPLLKAAFVRTVVQEWNRAIFLDNETVKSYAINEFSRTSYSYTTTAMDLHAFSNEDDCLRCIEQNSEERIFLIVSLASGKRVVPQTIKKYPDTLKRSNDHRARSVYLFRSNLPMADGLWSMKYPEYMLNFSCEIDLVRKLINDIARYFMDLGQKRYDFGTPASIHQSLEYLDWAGILLGRVFGTIDTWQCSETKSVLDKQIAQSEAALHNPSVSGDIDRCILLSDAGNQRKVGISETYEQISLGVASRPVFTESKIDQNDCHMEGDVNSTAVLVYLQPPRILTENFKNFQSLLKHLFATNLIIGTEVQEHVDLSKAKDSPIIVQAFSSNDDQQALENTCSMGFPISLYLLGEEPNTIDARRDFFTRYPQVCAIAYEPRELAIKVALDVALKSRVMGDRCAQSKDKERANIMYDQCIGLLNRLNTFALDDMDSRN